MARLSIHIVSGGERVPLLHDASGVPLFYPTLFATTQLRNAGAAVNTIRNKWTDIVVLMRWAHSQGRDLVEEFTIGRWLTLADIVSLRDFAKLPSDDERALCESSAKARSPRHRPLSPALYLCTQSAQVRRGPGAGFHYRRRRVAGLRLH
ncbi:hypothetical protein [Luteimonas chenhongjianii]|uniref:hypothetical protein n=1 Tax=Luteimonas chenhongjianii TaxID=2006110 RepID=UPI0015CFCDDD|nr:hypothetical protein [Luteimonas chenhongjianii]